MCSILNTEAFMRAAGQDIPAVPTLPTPEVAALRVSLLHEETIELQYALEDGDLVAVLDALADLQVVLDGAVLAFGMKGVIRPALAEVHRSNMSKFPQTMHEVFDTINHYAGQDIPAVMAVREPDHFVVLRKSDNKVLKSINYSPANLAPSTSLAMWNLIHRLRTAWHVLTSRWVIVHYEEERSHDICGRVHGRPDALFWAEISEYAGKRCDEAVADVLKQVEEGIDAQHQEQLLRQVQQQLGL